MCCKFYLELNVYLLNRYIVSQRIYYSFITRVSTRKYQSSCSQLKISRLINGAFIEASVIKPIKILFVVYVPTDDSVSADIKLETETEDGGVGEDVPSTLSPNMYHPRRALRNAINEWLEEFSRPKAVWGPIAKPQQLVAAAVPLPIIPSVNTCMSLTTTTTSCSSGSIPVVNSNQLQALAEVCSSVSSRDVHSFSVLYCGNIAGVGKFDARFNQKLLSSKKLCQSSILFQSCLLDFMMCLLLCIVPTSLTLFLYLVVLRAVQRKFTPKMAVFRAVAQYSLADIDRHLRGAYRLHHQGITLMGALLEHNAAKMGNGCWNTLL